MENENYYKRLREAHTIFNDLNLDKGQQERLRSLITYSAGSLNSLRNKIAELSQDIVHSEEYKREKLNEARAELQKEIDREFKAVQSRFALAQQALRNATHPEKPKDSNEKLLQFMEGREIRENLEKLPPAKRTEVLLDSVEVGNSAILMAIQARPLASVDLVPPDVLDRASRTYAERVAPGQYETLTAAKADLEAAEKVKNLTEIAMNYIGRGV